MKAGIVAMRWIAIRRSLLSLKVCDVLAITCLVHLLIPIC